MFFVPTKVRFQTLISSLPFSCINQRRSYVNVYMKWKKDSFFDSLEHIHKSPQLKRIVSLKNIILQNPNRCIPISDISKRGLEFDVKIRVATFMRQYPAIFEEFKGPNYNLPWFRLTDQALQIDEEEKRVQQVRKKDLLLRLKKLILMSKKRVLPVKIIKGMLWYLGLPEDFADDLGEDFAQKSDGFFRVLDLENGMKGLGAERDEKVQSFLQENALKRGTMEFPLFPSKGLRLKRKISYWLKEFQELAYLSPYEDFSGINPDSDIGEKRVVGFFHELLCLFVDHSAERRKILCLKKEFGLPQKMHKVFERHPYMFYLSLRNGTCSVILKEAYGNGCGMEKHPMVEVRKKYVELIMESEKIRERKRRKVCDQFVVEKQSSLDSAQSNGNLEESSIN